ncbi:hypothetical protein [Paraburkholderia sp. MM6662-R1]|uniref:hypothetical protein n=1 Tax=Paraburkholderia sp. MM6662-R1 TaxID=2991066 RepID=UPI003D204C1A
MAAADRNRPSSSDKTAFFFPPTLESVKRQGKKLRKMFGKEALHLSNAYNLAARIFGYQNYWAIREAHLSNDVRPTVWDHELSESQLRERRRVQTEVLATGMQISGAYALEILDACRLSARNVNLIDEQSLPEEFRGQVGGRAVVDDGGSRGLTGRIELGDSAGAAATAQFNQVKVVYRKRRLVQRAV